MYVSGVYVSQIAYLYIYAFVFRLTLHIAQVGDYQIRC